MPQAKYVIDVPAKTSGVISNIVADEIGIAAMLLGAGRATKEDEIDLAVGLMLRKSGRCSKRRRAIRNNLCKSRKCRRCKS